MVLGIIFALIAVGLAVYYANEEGEGIKGFLFYLFVLALFFGLIYGIIWMFLGMIKVDTGEISQEVLYNIDGLENNIVTTNNLSGSFVLGCGTISGSSSSKIVYYYFKENEYGKTLESLSAANSEIYIKEDNSIEPCLTQIYEIHKSNWLFNILFWENEILIPKCKILIVPEGTVKIEYNVDI